MTVELVPAELDDVAYIARRMRLRDREEIFATRFDNDPDAFAADATQVNGFSWVAKKDGEPVAVIGAKPLWPTTWTAFAFGTDRWREAALTLTRHAKRFMIPAVRNAGGTVVMAWSHHRHHEAHAWMFRLGARIEHKFEGMGRDDEAFILCVWRF